MKPGGNVLPLRAKFDLGLDYPIQVLLGEKQVILQAYLFLERHPFRNLWKKNSLHSWPGLRGLKYQWEGAKVSLRWKIFRISGFSESSGVVGDLEMVGDFDHETREQKKKEETIAPESHNINFRECSTSKPMQDPLTNTWFRSGQVSRKLRIASKTTQCCWWLACVYSTCL